DAMLEQGRTDKIPGELPAGTAANKSGETDTVSHDLAVVNTAQGRRVVAMVSSADGLGGGPDEGVAEAAAEVVGLCGGPGTFGRGPPGAAGGLAEAGRARARHEPPAPRCIDSPP